MHIQRSLLLCVILSACGGKTTESIIGDAGGLVTDTGTASTDTGVVDAGAVDANVVSDSGVVDAGSFVTVEEGAYGAIPYLSAADSPFAGIDYEYFYLEDWEDGVFTPPGVVVGGGGRLSSTFGSGLVDSVDGDDGDPTDGVCAADDGSCDSWWSAGQPGVSFTFDAEVLGSLPTHVGVVWTDGAGQVGVEATDVDGVVLFSFGPASDKTFPDSSITGTTAEDRFFGVAAAVGIKTLRLYNTAGGIEVDHFQFGRER